jgi:hypothetical protein
MLAPLRRTAAPAPALARPTGPARASTSAQAPMHRFDIARLAGAATHPPGQGVAQLKKRKRSLFSNKNKMSLGEFLNPAPWRRWTHTEHDSGIGDEVGHVPPSTYKTPGQMSHVTHYLALPSIRKTGLDPNRANAESGLNVRSGTSKYYARDAHLRAVYLGTDQGVGTSMEDEEQTAEGGRVELRAHLPMGFRHQYVRQASAAITQRPRPYDERATGNTALSFGRIPPEYLSVVHPETGRLHRLTDLRGEIGKEYDFRRFATQPTEGRDPLKSNQKAIDERAARALRMRNAAMMQPRREPEPVLAPKPKKKEEGPSFGSSAMNSMVARAMAARDNDSSSSDDEDWSD